MGVPETEVNELLQSSKVDHRIVGFDEEEKRLRRRISDGKNSLLPLPQGTYIFSEFRTLDIPGVEVSTDLLIHFSFFFPLFRSVVFLHYIH